VLQSLANLNDIDLLPDEYRTRCVQRRSYTYRSVVLLVFVAMFAGATLLQREHHARVRAQVVEVEAQYSQAAAHNLQATEVKARLQAERKSAELLTFLRHPWPRSQIMAAIAEPLTDAITLTDWQIVHENLPGGGANLPPADAKGVPTDKPTRRARDLKRLLQESAGQKQFVLLVGHASEAAALHEYLARLSANPLFLKIDLQSLESVSRERGQVPPTATHHFTARAILRPGYGQLPPSKPNTPSANPGSVPLAQRLPREVVQ
jgi:hypothetical protein